MLKPSKLTRGMLVALVGWGATILPHVSAARESAAVATSHTTATLVTDTDTIEPGHPFKAALRLQLAPGWHTYWKNAGDAGFAPELDFRLPPDATASQVAWPMPERMAEGPLVAYAYQQQVVLPVTIVANQAPLALGAHAAWLVCRDICVPEEGDFALTLPEGASRPSSEAKLFAQAEARTPMAASFQGVIAPDGTLTLSGPGLPPSISTAEFIPASDGLVETRGRQALHRGDGTLALALQFKPAADLHAPLSGVVEMTGSDGETAAFDITAQPSLAVLSPTPVVQDHKPVIFLLLTALGGGLLLNLMPCVFPVLAMKAMALSRLSGAAHRTIRAEAGSYTLGVVLAFMALGAGLVALRHAGQAVGWGFQLQSPVFVTVTAWILLATALNMSGVFAVGGQFAGSGQRLASKRGHAGSFFTGLLAVVVATPCTASFMGVAIAGALAAPAGTAMLVFATMGLGLALPYACLAVFPHLASRLPRPGLWMERLRQALAFPIYGAVAWLVWVVSQQVGSQGVLTASVGLVGIGFVAWAYGAAQSSAGLGRRLGRGAAALALFATAALLLPWPGAPTEPSEPFTPARLAELRREGRPVFVNMTASWCLSCLVNERLALSSQPVRDAFAHAHVAYLKGDWTRRDPAISAFLQQQGRDGVPLYLFYPPGQPPAVLPQVLGRSTVLDQVTKLGT